MHLENAAGLRIRCSRAEDLPAMLEIYERARRFMRETGNPEQWAGGYPPEELLRQDIAQGISYVAETEDGIEATFIYYQGEDPNYRVIEGGAWLSDKPYGVVHRIAVRGKSRGTGSACILWGLSQCQNLRMDTHRDNLVMQHTLEKNRFTRCGTIYLEDGSPRIAYQRDDTGGTKREGIRP